MSQQITTAFKQQYHDNVDLLVQQKGSVLRDAVRMETQVIGTDYYDQIGKVTASARTTRHGDTRYSDTPHSRRKVSLIPYDWADLIDKPDKLRTLNSFESPYATNGAFAMGRAMDAALCAAALGTAYTGETGGTSTALPTAQKIVVASAGLTLAKLINAREVLLFGDVDETEKLYIAVTQKQISNLLNDTKVPSKDYSEVQALVRGDIQYYCGFYFKRLSGSIISLSSTTRQCFAWAENGLLLAIGEDITTRIDELPTKNYSVQVFCSIDVGATRMEEAKVVQVDCLEA